MARSRRTWFVAAAGFVLLSPLAAACGDDAGAGDNPSISLIVGLKGDAFYGSMACGARAAAKRAGATLDVQGPGKWDAPEQIQVLNSVIAKQPDAILIAPVDDTALQAPLEEAEAQGIKIVLVDTTLKDPKPAASQVTSDDQLAGQHAAEEVVRETGGNGSVIAINTQPGVSTVEARMKGFEAGLKQAPGLKYLGRQNVGDDAAKAATAVTSTLAAHPDLSAVFATNTLTGQGAATGIKNANKTGEIKLVGFDANPSGVEALEDGTAQAQVVLKPLDIGTKGVEQAINALNDKPVEKLIRTDSLIATKDSLATKPVKTYLYNDSCTG
ncbi:ABC transporter substrate-binding protein [Flindersiella endophytica]